MAGKLMIHLGLSCNYFTFINYKTIFIYNLNFEDLTTVAPFASKYPSHTCHVNSSKLQPFEGG